jgi:SAM-dependent methyltransferase
MDLRSFKFHRPDRHVRAVLGDHRGQISRDLEGDAFDRVAAVADKAMAGLEQQAGAVRALSVDGVARVLRLTTDTTPPRPLVLTEADFERYAGELSPLARAILGEVRARQEDLAGVTPSQAAFWEHLYAGDDAGWEIGRAAPPLMDFFEKNPPWGARVLVVGCGRGHEARMLAELGARVTGVDLSKKAIAAARAMGPVDVEYRVADLFEPMTEQFDVVVEHTCFCAIEAGRRDEYVDRMADALVEGGRLVGLFYDHGRPGGPPYTTDRSELVMRFGRRFSVEGLETAVGSVLARAGQELFGRFKRSS